MSAVSPDAPQGVSGAQWVASFAIALKLENSHSGRWPVDFDVNKAGASKGTPVFDDNTLENGMSKRS
jgi:hypothetical protein